MPQFAAETPLLRDARPAETDVRELPVKGDLPPGLDGMLLRIGPDDKDGQPLLAALRVQQGHAEWFRTRRIRTDRVCEITGELPSPGPRRCPSDNTHAAVVQHAGRILALADGALPYELSADLATKARHDFDGTLPFGFTAHPVHDPLTGEMFAAVSSPVTPHLWYVVVDVHGRVRRCEPITSSPGPGSPAFSVTHRHAVFHEPTRIGIMPCTGTAQQLSWIPVEPVHVLQVVNAYDLPDRRLVLDVVRRAPLGPVLWRWTLDPVSGTASGELLDPRAQAFLAVDPRCTGSEHRYGFATGIDSASRRGNSLVRHDFASGDSQIHVPGADRTVGPPVFVPRSPTAAEGDGWVLAATRDPGGGHDEIVVLDTRDFEGGPAALVGLPAAGPWWAHASWLVTASW
ncbi:carotenoid oxygenase family protein [Streptomyces sp. NPDC019224]|uniref:carotenoid oxygenase family protein n=1 Tax=Streptomyces sp. NPDC019224 TaxID=3154484 RepID=UPI00340E7225